MSNVCIGKLHFAGDKQEAVEVKYRFYSESSAGWRGEFLPQESRNFIEGEGYVIELEDGRRGRCAIRRMVNRVMPTVPPVYAYYFRGMGRLDKTEEPEE
ncbi:MAG: hypothetical protein PVJ61_00710 [Dehalococcoidia bacterium]|jgi:hypothetical protein